MDTSCEYDERKQHVGRMLVYIYIMSISRSDLVRRNLPAEMCVLRTGCLSRKCGLDLQQPSRDKMQTGNGCTSLSWMGGGRTIR